MAKNTICLWYEKDAEAAARFYAETFPGSAVGAVHRAPSDYPSGKEGDVLTVDFTVAGVPCIGLNGGTLHDEPKFSELFSPAFGLSHSLRHQTHRANLRHTASALLEGAVRGGRHNLLGRIL